MAKSKKQKEHEEVELIVERFKGLSTEELINRRDLFGSSLSSPFKKAKDRILKSRGVGIKDVEK